MPLKYFIYCVLILLCSDLYAYTINGTVCDEATRDSLPGCHIWLNGTPEGMITDIQGHFEFHNIKNDPQEIVISHLGYALTTISVSRQKSLNLLIKLVPDTLELNQVVYTATRTMQLLSEVPVTTELIGMQEIKQTASYSLSEALENKTGIEVKDDFSGQGVMLQGIDPERILVLVDGNRVIGRVNGSLDLSQLSLMGVKHIEVVKGAVSTLYGSEGIGGVINIITEPPQKKISLNLDLNQGWYAPDRDPLKVKNNLMSPSLDLGVNAGKVAFRFGTSFNRSAKIDIDPSTLHTEGAAAVTRLNLNSRLDYKFNEKSKVILTGSKMDEDKYWVEDSGLKSVPVAYDDEEDNHRNDLALEYVHEPEWGNFYSLKVYASENNHFWGKYTQGVRHLKDFSESDEGYLQFTGQATRNLGSVNRITLGMDHYWWDIEALSSVKGSTENFDSEIKDRLNAWDVFLQDEYYFNSKVTLVPGIRYERHKVYGVHISPQISYKQKLSKSTTFRTSVAQGYRAPTSKELYYVFNHASAGYIVLGNRDLEPETSLNFNVSLEHNYKDKTASRISLFYNDMENLIDFDSLTSSEEYYTGIYRYENILSAWTRGIEVERSMRWGRSWEVGMGYTFMETENAETGKQLMRRPKHKARISVNWKPDPLFFRVWGVYTGKMLYQDRHATDDLTGNEWTNPYTLWNAVCSIKMNENSQLYLKVKNLFDHVHSRYGPYRGRIIMMGWRLSLFSEE